MNKTRRILIGSLAGIFASLPAHRALAWFNRIGVTGNFSYIYGNTSHRNEFKPFLENVFNLYPETELHRLIHLLNNEHSSDQAVYTALQNNLDDVTPFLSDIRYSLPALSKQKEVITKQTCQLLDTKKAYQGYLEIGSTGRYLDGLEEELTISGERYFVTDKPASYSPIDMIDRGQLAKAGDDILLNNYQTKLNKIIPSRSLDLVTVYIGFHHCPLSLREEFITSIRDSMSDKGVLILRDHDVVNEKMAHMVGLAHDVFNMGTNEPWDINANELRHFYSLNALNKFMIQFGFHPDDNILFQKGDPTRNALMMFTKA